MSTVEKLSIADLVAKYGSSSATAWLEFERYKLWQPSETVPESSFTPVQGYMEQDPYIFAWGNPLVSDPSALSNVARQFIQWSESVDKRPVWCCVDVDLEDILASEFGWCTVSCIYEDIIDPGHVIELTSPESKGQEGQKVIKDLKKNLYRAEKYHVNVKEVLPNEWMEEDKIAVEEGIRAWKASKLGIQIASTTGLPWLDSEHRRYWIAKRDGETVGILILTPVHSTTWQIKNAISFPSAPKGTSEALIYTALKDLHTEQEEALRSGGKVPHPSNQNFHGGKVIPATTVLDHSASDSANSSAESISENSDDGGQRLSTPPSDTGTSDPSSGTSKTKNRSPLSRATRCDADRVSVTFGLSAAPKLEPVHNLGGWKVSALSKTYNKVVKGTRLVQRGEFRNKFDSSQEPMYVCYPSDGFGLDGVNTLLKVLRK